jgi:hypothetical protein
MYTKEQASQLKQAFWTAFGQYMGPVLSAEGLRTNWINYKTGVKHIFFRMQADNKMASIAIEIAHYQSYLYGDCPCQHFSKGRLAEADLILQTPHYCFR